MKIFLATPSQLEAEKTNLGEKAIFEETIRRFKKLLPDSKIYVPSSNPAYTEKNYPVTAIGIKGVGSFVDIIKAIRACDALIAGGGELIQDKSSLVMIPSNLAGPFIAKLLGKKVIGYGIGVGEKAEITKFGQLLTKLIVNQFDLITVRDHKSKTTLKKLGVTKPKIFESADIAITLPKAPSTQVCKALKRAGFGGNNYAVFSMRSVYHRTHHPIPFSYRKRWGLLPKEYLKKIAEFKKKIARAADYLIQKYQVKILFVPAYFGEGFSALDDKLCQEIINLMKNKTDNAFLVKEVSPKIVRGIMGGAKLVVGVPLHSLILAGSENAPVICISYASKHRCYMEQIGQKRCVIRAENPDDEFSLKKLTDMIDEVWQSRRAIKKTLKEKNKKLSEKSYDGARIVAQFIKNL